MKVLLVLATLLLSYYSTALEIQCSTNQDGIDAAIKKSPGTGLVYLLLLQGEAVSPIHLYAETLEVSKDKVRYLSSNISIDLDRVEKEGSVLFKDGSNLNLFSCEEY